EVLGHLVAPSGKRLVRRQSVEAVVELDGGEPLGVVGEPGALRNLGGIEHATPVPVVPSARAHVDRHGPSPDSALPTGYAQCVGAPRAADRAGTPTRRRSRARPGRRTLPTGR